MNAAIQNAKYVIYFFFKEACFKYHWRGRGNCLAVSLDKLIIDLVLHQLFQNHKCLVNAICKLLIPVFASLTFGLIKVICMQTYGLVDEEYVLLLKVQKIS